MYVYIYCARKHNTTQTNTQLASILVTALFYTNPTVYHPQVRIQSFSLGFVKRKSSSAESIAFASVGECNYGGAEGAAAAGPSTSASCYGTGRRKSSISVVEEEATRRQNRIRERERQAEARRRRRDTMSFRNVYRALRMRLSSKRIPIFLQTLITYIYILCCHFEWNPYR